MPNLKLGYSDNNLCLLLVSFSAEFLAGSTLLSQ